jgi:hypothetical protein
MVWGGEIGEESLASIADWDSGKRECYIPLRCDPLRTCWKGPHTCMRGSLELLGARNLFGPQYRGNNLAREMKACLYLQILQCMRQIGNALHSMCLEQNT